MTTKTETRRFTPAELVVVRRLVSEERLRRMAMPCHARNRVQTNEADAGVLRALSDGREYTTPEVATAAEVSLDRARNALRRQVNAGVVCLSGRKGLTAIWRLAQ